MNTVGGYAMSSWERGYGDFEMRPTWTRCGSRRGIRAPRCASRTCTGSTAGRSSPRHARSCARSSSASAERGWQAYAGTELEFIVFRDSL